MYKPYREHKYLSGSITDRKYGYFVSTLLDHGKLFSSHTVNTLIDLEDNGQTNHHNNNNNYVANDTTNNTNI